MINIVVTLLVLTILLICQSCGKAVQTETTAPTNDGPGVEPVLPASIVLRDNDEESDGRGIASSSDKDQFTFPQLARVSVPSHIFIEQGNAGNAQASIYFNLEKGTGFFDINCLYQGGASTTSPIDENDFQEGLKYTLVDCYDPWNNPMGVEAGERIWIDQDNAIKMDMEAADPRFENKSITTLEIEWR